MKRTRYLFRHAGRAAAFTLVELMIAMSLLAIVGYNLYTVLAAADKGGDSVSAQMVLEDHANSVLDRIAAQVMAASRETLDSTSVEPLTAPDISYRVQAGLDAAGNIVLDDPELIWKSDADSRVQWSQTPEAASERRVVWSNFVTPLLEGEVMDGIDNNGNGLIDETGLSFVIDRNAVTVRMTCERRSSEGEVVTTTVEKTVTCRNPGNAGS